MKATTSNCLFTLVLVWLSLFCYTLQAATAAAPPTIIHVGMKCATHPSAAGLYHYPNDCTKYYYCVAGNPEPTVHYCPAYTLYSISLRRCVAASRVNQACNANQML
ncbi:MAG: hypothetical protein EXX96DRAFT_576416, partial [Benjaminiella poitrasii]